MSHHTVRARVRLSFKGETHDLDAVVDLDLPGGDAPDFHRILAHTAGIDPYSYLYEVLESHEIEFSAPTGAAAGACEDGRFDWGRFTAARAAERDWGAVETAARPLLGDRLDTDAELRAALLAVYRAGRADASR